MWLFVTSNKWVSVLVIPHTITNAALTGSLGTSALTYVRTVTETMTAVETARFFMILTVLEPAADRVKTDLKH